MSLYVRSSININEPNIYEHECIKRVRYKLCRLLKGLGREISNHDKPCYVKSIYYTIIDFNEADMRIYLPKKVIFIEATRVDKSLCLPKLKSITVLLYAFSTVNEFFCFPFRN